MSVTEDLQNLALNSPNGCKVCYYLETMGNIHADNMRKALAAPKERYPHTDLADIFVRNGMSVSESGIRRHRKHCK